MSFLPTGRCSFASKAEHFASTAIAMKKKGKMKTWVLKKNDLLRPFLTNMIVIYLNCRNQK